MTIQKQPPTSGIVNSGDAGHDLAEPLTSLPPVDDEQAAKDALREKMTDPYTPGVAVDFDPAEAEQAGAFQEDALSEQDAADSTIDLATVDGEILAAFVADDDHSGPNDPPAHVTTANARELFGWRPGETVGEAAMRAAKKD